MIKITSTLKRLSPVIALCAIGWGITTHAVATNEYPNKTIEVVTHAGNGGGTDLTARMMMLQARKVLGKDMVVVNKKGGGGIASMEHYKTLPADGHSILTFTVSHAASIAKGKSDISLDDFTPIARATDDPQIIMAKCGIYKDANDFIERQKEKTFVYGVTHLGNIDDVSAAMFAKKAGLKKPRMLPYDGGGQLAQALANDRVDAGVLNLAEASDLIDTGKVCPQIVLAEKRMARLNDVPTAMELGIPVKFSTVRGFVVHKDTPPHIAMQIEASLLKAMNHNLFKGFLVSIGLEANSIAGSEVWGKQISETHDEMKMAFQELGVTH